MASASADRKLLNAARVASGIAAGIAGVRVFEKLTGILLIEPAGMPAPNPLWTSLSIFVLNGGVFFMDRIRARSALRVAFQVIAAVTFLASVASVATHFTSFQPQILYRTRLPGVVTLSFVGAGVLLLSTERWRGVGVLFGFVAMSIAFVITLGIIYGGALITGVPVPMVSIASALGGVLTGAGMVASEGTNSWLLRPFAGNSVRAVLLRWLLPTSAVIMLVSDFTSLRVFQGFSSAIGSSINTVISLLVTAVIISSAAAILGHRLEAAAAERRRLEEELRQVQKIHAVGQLAGGIAHDFNNLLSVITASTTVAMRDVQEDSVAQAELKEILEAADRGAALTRQLLAFSRKQALAPTNVDLNKVVRRTTHMLRRLIGSGIEVVVETGADTGIVRADIGQIEQVLLNLAANARDALPDGGRIVFATSNREADAEFVSRHAEAIPGHYSTVSVSDNGTGMSEDVRKHIFEPFFTTKEEAKGTGLGLATTFGIVRQSGGFIDVQTSEGEGTTFTIYLPRLSGVGPLDSSSPSSAPANHDPRMLLLVEDEPAIRRFSRTTLQRAGYDVIEAENVPDAMEKWSAYRTAICVVITDIGLSGDQTGWDLISKVESEDPELPIIIASGEAQGENGGAGGRRRYLEKPYGATELLEVVSRSCAVSGRKKPDSAETLSGLHIS